MYFYVIQIFKPFKYEGFYGGGLGREEILSYQLGQCCGNLNGAHTYTQVCMITSHQTGEI